MGRASTYVSYILQGATHRMKATYLVQFMGETRFTANAPVRIQLLGIQELKWKVSVPHLPSRGSNPYKIGETVSICSFESFEDPSGEDDVKGGPLKLSSRSFPPLNSFCAWFEGSFSRKSFRNMDFYLRCQNSAGVRRAHKYWYLFGRWCIGE